MCSVFQANTSIARLNLEDNWIEAEGLIHLVQVLRENNSIQELVGSDGLGVGMTRLAVYSLLGVALLQDLANNHLGVQGSDVLSRMLLDNLSLHGLRLARKLLLHPEDPIEEVAAL